MPKCILIVAFCANVISQFEVFVFNTRKVVDCHFLKFVERVIPSETEGHYVRRVVFVVVVEEVFSDTLNLERLEIASGKSVYYTAFN